jgi:hypothetical protein
MTIAARLAAIGNLVGFTYTMVPLSSSVAETPAIPYSFYDPDKGAYVDLTTPPIPVTVSSKANVAEDVQELLKSDNVRTAKEPVLGSLARSPGWSAQGLVPVQLQAWFPLAQLAPAAAFLGLWLWDRRRRFLEHHPEVVWRQRARRSLRRERRRMRRAAGRGDSPGFANAALNALRAACAPEFRAEPRALIGSDVLQVVRELDQGSTTQAEPVVRRLFESTDASRFGVTQTHEPLLGLCPEVEQVLERLEARL